MLSMRHRADRDQTTATIRHRLQGAQYELEQSLREARDVQLGRGLQNEIAEALLRVEGLLQLHALRG